MSSRVGRRAQSRLEAAMKTTLAASRAGVWASGYQGQGQGSRGGAGAAAARGVRAAAGLQQQQQQAGEHRLLLHGEIAWCCWPPARLPYAVFQWRSCPYP